MLGDTQFKREKKAIENSVLKPKPFPGLIVKLLGDLGFLKKKSTFITQILDLMGASSLEATLLE